jgi:aminoglycoside/choline kinase family phosphotransferase
VRSPTLSSLNLDDAMVLRKGRATVMRVRSGAGSVIVKQFTPSQRPHFVRERSGLKLLGSVAALGFVPRVLAEDEPALALLLEDIGETAPFSARIQAQNEDSALLLANVARRLGELHGHARALAPRFRSEVPEPPSAGTLLKENASATLAFVQRALSPEHSPATSAEFGLDSALHAELLSVAEGVDEPSSLVTLSLGDLAPSNILLGARGPVFIDLEYCAARHAFYDAMFWHCIYPLPSDLPARMDASYRAGLHSVGVELEEEEFHRAMLRFMSQRLFWTLSWDMISLFERDRELVPGVSTRLTLCQYLDEYLRFAAQVPKLDHPNLLRVAQRLSAHLSTLWPS